MPLFDHHYYSPPRGSRPHGIHFPETRFERILKYIVFILIVLVFIIGLLVAIFKSPSESKTTDAKKQEDKQSDAKTSENAPNEPQKK